LLVFWNENLVYLAVPKTGTTALEAALDPHASLSWRRPANIKHSHAYRFHTFVQPLLDRSARKKWELVAVIREPVSWLGSWYRYLQRPGTETDPRSTRDVSFDQFVEDHLSHSPPAHADVGRQSFMVLADDGKLLVDHLFAYEQQDALIAFFETRLGKTLKVPQRNVSPDTPVALSPGLEARLRREKAKEFDLHALAVTMGGEII